MIAILRFEGGEIKFKGGYFPTRCCERGLRDGVRSSKLAIPGKAEKRALSANDLKICSRAVAHIPGVNIKEFL
jgi:hypothetical protein